jgi:hypothetical protein
MAISRLRISALPLMASVTGRRLKTTSLTGLRDV